MLYQKATTEICVWIISIPENYSTRSSVINISFALVKTLHTEEHVIIKNIDSIPLGHQRPSDPQM